MTPDVKDDGRAARWASHRRERRAELVEAAVRAIDRHGPDASIADMADEAGVSKPVLYRYFSDKQELIAAVGQHGAQLVLDRLMPTFLLDVPVRERVSAGCDAYFSVIEEHPQVFLLLVRHHSGSSDPLATGKATIAAALARAFGDRLRQLGVDAGGAEPWAEGLVGLGISTGEWWVTRQTMSRAAVSAYLASFVFHAFDGIVTEYGAAPRRPRDRDRPGGDSDTPKTPDTRVTPIRRGEPA